MVSSVRISPNASAGSVGISLPRHDEYGWTYYTISLGSVHPRWTFLRFVEKGLLKQGDNPLAPYEYIYTEHSYETQEGVDAGRYRTTKIIEEIVAEFVHAETDLPLRVPGGLIISADGGNIIRDD